MDVSLYFTFGSFRNGTRNKKKVWKICWNGFTFTHLEVRPKYPKVRFFVCKRNKIISIIGNKPKQVHFQSLTSTNLGMRMRFFETYVLKWAHPYSTWALSTEHSWFMVHGISSCSKLIYIHFTEFNVQCSLINSGHNHDPYLYAGLRPITSDL